MSDFEQGPAEERLRELAVQATIHLSSVLRVAAVYDARDHIVQMQVDKLERTLREILQIVPGAVFTTLGSELYLNEVRVPSRASQYKFIRTVLDEFARREMDGIRFAPGFEREELNRFLEEFLRSGITGSALLDACRASGEGHVLPVTRDSAEGFDETDDETDAVHERPHPEISQVAPEFPSLAARRRHAHALKGARALFQALHKEDLEFRQAKRIVQPIVEASGSEEPVWTAGAQDDDTATHAVQVCSIASSMGRALGFDRRALADIGVAALFHDAGQSAIDDIPRSIDGFTDEDWAAAASHGAAGAKRMARSTAMSPTTLRCVRVAIEHHWVPGPQESVAATADRPARCRYPARVGLPDELVGRSMSVLSQIVAVADTFVSFQAHRSERGRRLTPHEALSLALAECRGKFEDALLWALVRATGVYPLGQLVQMDDGAFAIVVSVNSDDPWRPGVRVIRDAAGRMIPAGEAPLLMPLTQGRTLRRALRIEEYPGDLGEYGLPVDARREAA